MLEFAHAYIGSHYARPDARLDVRLGNQGQPLKCQSGQLILQTSSHQFMPSSVSSASSASSAVQLVPVKSFKPSTRRKASPSRLHLLSMRPDLFSCSMLCRGPSAPSHLAFTATTLPGCYGDSARRSIFFIGPCLGRLLTGGSLALLYEALTGDVQKLFARFELFTCSAAKLLRFCGAKGDDGWAASSPGRWPQDWLAVRPIGAAHALRDAKLCRQRA